MGDDTMTRLEGEYQVVYSTRDGRQIISFSVSEGDNIKDGDGNYTACFIGKHALSTATISYWTVGYNISLRTCVDGNVTALGDDKKRLNILLVKDFMDIDPNYVVTYYYLNKKELISNVRDLLMKKHGNDVAKVNAEFTSEHGVDVYFNNIFRSYKRTGGSGSSIPTASAFISGELHNKADFLANQAWGAGTRDIISYYYNIKLTIKVDLYKYKVIYSDSDGVEIALVSENNKIYLYGDVSHVITGMANDVLKIDGKEYKYVKSEYIYDMTVSGSNEKTAVTKNGNKLSSKHQKESDATLNVIFTTPIPTEITPTPTPSEVSPTPSPPGTSPTPDIPPPGRQETKTMTVVDYMSPVLSAKIDADERGNERFDVLQAIPTSESVYAEVRATEYLLYLTFGNVKGIVTFYVPVSRTYQLSYNEADPETGLDTLKNEEKEVVDVVMVQREYEYNTVEGISYYMIEQARLKNYVFDAGELVIMPKDYEVPTITYACHGETADRAIEPPQLQEGVPETIILPPMVLPFGTSEVPPMEDVAAEVDGMIPQIMIKNDQFCFGDVVVLEDGYYEITAPELSTGLIREPDIIDKDVLFSPNNIIEARKNNGTYISTGDITYILATGYKDTVGDMQNFIIEDVNSVTVHTPVYCLGHMNNDNKRYVQLLEPDHKSVPIVLDTKSHSSGFVVTISNYGTHNPYKGYGTRDYSKYVQRNEVVFPFDVYIDIGNDGDDGNDVLISADTWCAISPTGQRFHAPMWVREGQYTTRYRTIAINCNGREDTGIDNANTYINSYAGVDYEDVQVSGKVYGLTLYDINDETWVPAFRVPNSIKLKRNVGGADGTLIGSIYDRNKVYYYAVGTNDQYGLSVKRDAKYTLPLVAGSHPFLANQGILKAGYIWRFMFQTTGNEMMSDQSYVRITPRFFYVDKNGKNREEVDIYYTAYINGVRKSLVKIGSLLDDSNKKLERTGNEYLSIPESELAITAAIRNRALLDWKAQRTIMYTYQGITTNVAFKTFSNKAYTDMVLGRSGPRPNVGNNDITSRKQSYYFNYSLPNSFKAVSKGFDITPYVARGITYKEAFWKKEGYIIINFDITCYDKDGKAYMSYGNNDNHVNYGYGNMWVLEGAPRTKTDYYGVTFDIRNGDVLMVYTDRTNVDDYDSRGIY